MDIEYSRFSVFILLSILLHGLIIAWVYFKQEEKTVVVKPANALIISAGLQAAIAGAQKPQIKATPKIAEPAPVKKPVIAAKNLVPISKPVKKRVKKTPTKKQLVQKKVTQKSPVKQIAKPKITPVTKAGSQGVSGSNAQVTKQRETGKENQAAGNSENDAQFDFYIRQHLLSKKTTPNLSRARNRKGVVTVEFTINRQGSILAYKIATSSKIREFDRAAMRLIRKAEPFPKAPSYITWKTRKFTVDIAYSVK